MDIKSGRITEIEKTKNKNYTKTETINVSVEEIENGFIITKECKCIYKVDKKYNPSGEDYDYKNFKYFSKSNPLTIKLDNTSLADAFDE
jgi:hypothetical protein